MAAVASWQDGSLHAPDRRMFHSNSTDAHRAFAPQQADTGATLLFIAFSTVAACMPVHNDTWWHLRLGREMWQSGSLLQTEHFGYLIAGTPVHNLEWLTQILFFLLFSIGGPFLLPVFCGACALTAVWLSWRMLTGSSQSRFLLLAILLIGVVSEWAVLASSDQPANARDVRVSGG